MISEMIDTILFDNWNTLVQAPQLMKTGASVTIFQDSLYRNGLDYNRQTFIDIYKRIAHHQVAESEARGWTEIDYVKRLTLTLESLGVEDPQRSKLANLAWEEYMNEWPKQTSFFPETPGLLKDLGGKYKLGLVTNFMDGPIARRIFKDLGYEAIFNSLIVSAEVGYMKPSSILFIKALDELSSKPENTIMVGDTYEADIIGAHRSGIRGVLIDLYNAPREKVEGSDAVIKSIGGLLDVLNQFL